MYGQLDTRGFKIIDDKNQEHTFTVAYTEQGGRGCVIASLPWEPGDPTHAWRVPLHPFHGGLHSDRLRNRTVYVGSNADASYEYLLVPPPKLNSLALANGVSPDKLVQFDGKLFAVDGRYMYYYDPATDTVTLDNDFGVGKTAVDAYVFNNELIVAMGASEKIWKRTAAGAWSQAADNVFAVALGVVGSRLYRGTGTNGIASCSTTPLTLTNWNDAAGYTVGDTTWTVNSIIDYGGVAWVGKGDGMYAPDAQTRFFNQTPQISRYPHVDNCKGVFTAKGALWVPSASGMIKILPGGISKISGPEKSARPSFRFWVRGGVEWGGDIYLIVTDEGASANTFICKMQLDAFDLVPEQDFIYHEWVRAGATTKGYAIAIIATQSQPRMAFALGPDLRWLKLGRGGGRDIDDANYEYGTAMELETGPFVPVGDISATSTIVGASVLLDYSSAGETLSMQVSTDGGTYYDMLDTQESGGIAPIQLTDGWESVLRYAPKASKGQFFSLKLTGGLTSASGTGRPEIRELWAFGMSHPKVTDKISIAIAAESGITNDGAMSLKSASEIHDQFKRWHNQGILLELRLNNYEENKPIRVVVSDVKALDAVSTLGPGESVSTQYQVQVELVRVDYANGYGA